MWKTYSEVRKWHILAHASNSEHYYRCLTVSLIQFRNAMIEGKNSGFVNPVMLGPITGNTGVEVIENVTDSTKRSEYSSPVLPPPRKKATGSTGNASYLKTIKRWRSCLLLRCALYVLLKTETVITHMDRLVQFTKRKWSRQRKREIKCGIFYSIAFCIWSSFY